MLERLRARIARTRRPPDVVVYAGSWVDEVWVRSTIEACAAGGMSVELAVSAPADAQPPEVGPAYEGLDVTLSPGADRAAIEALTGGLLLSATTNIGELPFRDGWTKVHMPHSLVSLHMIYPADGFDGYDVLFACGPHHVAEFDALSRWRSLDGRRSFEIGYGKLDVFRASARGAGLPAASAAPRTVLLAPSSGDGNILETIGPALIRELIARELHVVLRPHPMFCAPGNELVESLFAEFGSGDRFRLESSLEGDDAIYTADALITDYSGIAMEFAAIRPRPVVYVEVPRKVLNPDWQHVGLEPVEVSLRDRFGTIVAPDPVAVAEAAGAGRLDEESQRAALGEVLFDGDATCGRRAADAIRELLR